jgi:hypothetical protein
MTPVRALLLFAGVAALPLTRASATDEIICNSKTYNVALSVGSNQYVGGMVVADATGERFDAPVEITEFAAKRRHVSIQHQRVDVEGWPVGERANRVVIRIEHGKGYIEVVGNREGASCDWRI